MPYPTGMVTFQKRFGPAYAMTDGSNLRMVVAITASTSAIWAATATPLVAFFQNKEASPGLQGILTLPSPDQDGFIDGKGNTVRNWTYEADITYYSGYTVIGQATTNFSYVAGGPSPTDLENSVPVPGTTGQRVAITVPAGAHLDGDYLVLTDLTGAEMFRGNVRGLPGTNGSDASVYDGGVSF